MKKQNIVIISNGVQTDIMVNGKTIENVLKVSFIHDNEGQKVSDPRLEITYDDVMPRFGSEDMACDFAHRAMKYMEKPQLL